MKAGAKPEMTQKWWSKNKAKTLKSTGLGGALKKYEIAKDQFDAELMNKALKEVEGKVGQAIKACNPKFHRDTQAALEKYRPLIAKAYKEAKELAAKNAAIGAKEAAAAPPQKMAGMDVFWEGDLARMFKSASKCDWIKDFKGMTIRLTLDRSIQRVFIAENDNRTPAFMVEDAQGIAKETVKLLVKAADDLEKGQPDLKKRIASFEKYCHAVAKEAGKKLKKVPEVRWAKFVAKAKQYKEYQVKAGVDLALNSLAVTGSAVALATTPFTGGVSGALGIIGMIKSVSALAQQCVDLAKKAEGVEKGLRSDLEGLKKSYLTAEGEAKKSVGAQEMAKTVANTLLTGPFVRSIPKCEDSFDLWSNKVAGLFVAGDKLSKAFTLTLKKVDEFERDLKKNVDAKQAGKVFDKLKKLRAQLSKAFDKAADMNGRALHGERAEKNLKKMLAALKGANPNYAVIFNKVFPSVVELGLVGASAGVGFADAKKTVEFVQASLDLGNGLLSEVKNPPRVRGGPVRHGRRPAVSDTVRRRACISQRPVTAPSKRGNGLETVVAAGSDPAGRHCQQLRVRFRVDRANRSSGSRPLRGEGTTLWRSHP